RISSIGLRGAEGIVIASALNGIAKALAGRVRPFVAPGEPWHWNFNQGWSDPHLQSMPSGHTAATIAFAAAIGVASTGVQRTPRLLLVSAAFVSAFFVGFARTYTNQHWFSDVCAGAIIGIASGVFIARWHERHPRTAFDRTLLGASPEGTR